MKHYQLLVFDWDGTLMDSAARIVASMQSAALTTGLPVPSDEAVRDIIGLGLREAIERLFPAIEAPLLETLVAAYRVHFLEACPVPAQLFRGARETLDHLRQRGFRLAIATGKGRQGLDRALQEQGLSAYFEASRCADETRSKPHPLMLQQLMTQARVAPDATLMIGDTEYDMEMARSAGAHGLAATYGVHARERLARHQPVAYMDAIDELIQWLEQA